MELQKSQNIWLNEWKISKVAGAKSVSDFDQNYTKEFELFFRCNFVNSGFSQFFKTPMQNSETNSLIKKRQEQSL